MKPLTRLNTVVTTVFTLFFAGSLPALAGVSFKETAPAMRDEVPADEINLKLEQTFQSDFEQGHGYSEKHPGDNNNTNTWHYEVEAARRVELTDHWYLKLGIDWERFDFGDNRSLAPNTLQSYAAVIALEYWQHGQIGFFIESKPGLYFAHELSGDAFDAPTNVALAYPIVDDTFYIIGGITASRFREYPVLPIGGVLWHINEKWDLRAYLPEPKLVYKTSEHLELWGGGEIAGSQFRNDSFVGVQSSVSKQPVEYYELRAGGGLYWTGWKWLRLEFAAGYAFERKFVFYDTNVPDQETKGAPYVKLQGVWQF